MPAASCRDVDEVCDWFLRDGDPGELLIHAFLHFEGDHKEVLTRHVAEMGPAKMAERFIAEWRDYPWAGKPIVSY